MPSGGDLAKQGANDAATSAVASKLGGFGGMMGGFGHKKKAAPAPSSDTPASTQQPASMVLMESTTEMGGFSTAALDGSVFLPPAGYQHVPIPDIHNLPHQK
jgi:hypothetical protein